MAGRGPQARGLAANWKSAGVPLIAPLTITVRRYQFLSYVYMVPRTPEAAKEAAEIFIAERRLGTLLEVTEDEAAIPILPGRTGDASSLKNPTGVPVAQISMGTIAVMITCGMLLVALHEHHHETHNKPNKIERNAEYFLYMLLTFRFVLPPLHALICFRGTTPECLEFL